MIYNQNVNFTPDTPATCRPTSGIVCTYCRNARNCNNQVPRDDLYGFDSKTDTTKIVQLDSGKVTAEMVAEATLEPAHVTDFS